MNVSPVAGRVNPYTYSHSYFVRPEDVGRHPLSHQTRRVTGLSPSRASSSAHTSTGFPGLASRSRLTRRRTFFSTAGGSGGRPTGGGPGGGPAT